MAESGPGRPLETLRQTPLFAGLSREALVELAALCAPRWLEGGEYLFHAGAPADNLYVIASGGLEVVRLAGDKELLLTVLGPGRAVGELAILRGEPRSASVRAQGPTLVHCVDGRAFLEFVHRWPQVAVAVARQVAENLVRAENKGRLAAEHPVWAVVTSDPALADFPLLLARAALQHLTAAGRRVVVLTAAGPAGKRADFLERGARIQIRPLSAASEHDAEPLGETALVIAAAPLHALGPLMHKVTGIVLGPGESLPAGHERARRIELSWRGAPSATQVSLRGSPARAAGRVARLLLGRSVGVALGGGGARGLAHLGVLKVLAQVGVPIDFVAGTSMGALVGAFFVANGLEASIAVVLERSRPRDWLRLIDPMMFFSGMVRGTKLVSFFDKLAIRTFEELELPFAAIAFDLDSGDEHVAREGRLVDGLLASISIPGIFAPYAYQPPRSRRIRRFVDGAVSNNVPVDAARMMGADRVVGVHVLGPRNDAGAARPEGASAWVASRLAQVPTIARAMAVLKSQLHGHERLGEKQVLTADLAIMVDTAAFRFTDFWRAPEMIEAGHGAAMQVEDQLRLLRT